MFRHVGTYGERKVIVLFRQLKDEEHMCLVVYPDTMPSAYHDPMMAILESNKAQEGALTKDGFAYALTGTMFPSNNKDMLTTLYKEGMIKKIQTNQVIIKPNAKTAVHLNEVNEHMNAIEQGGEAVRKMAELDANAGMTSKATQQDTTTVLGDENIAQLNLDQANVMETQAQSMIAEANALRETAYNMQPNLRPKKRGRKPSAKKQ